MDEPTSWVAVVLVRGADVIACGATEDDVSYFEFVYDHMVGAVAAKLGFCAKT